MSSIVGNVTGCIFTFDKLKDKLSREIIRLKKAEEDGNIDDAMDFALNAAFTGYHLIEWQEKDVNPNGMVKARDLLSQKNDNNFNLLHDVVTKAKHVTVSNSAISGQAIDVRTSVVGDEKISEFGDILIAEIANYRLQSIFVKFGSERARKILENVLSSF